MYTAVDYAYIAVQYFQPTCDWACAVTTDCARVWERCDMEERGREGWGGWWECPNRDWFLESREPRDRSVSLRRQV